MATTAQHLAARGDEDLLHRLIASAEQADIQGATQWVQQNMGRLITIPVTEGQSIADIRAYADTVRAAAIAALPPAPGLDPAAVTDTHLQAAVTALAP